MILYHGTNIDFSTIDITKSSPFKDFGKGFYLTDIKSQAEKLATKKAQLFKGTPILQMYEFDEQFLKSSSFKVLMFESPSREWAEFIFKNRNRELNFHHDYDIVYGPIANDGVVYLIGRYEEGTMSLEELAEQLKYSDLNNQYFFGTDKAVKLLKRL